MTRHTIQNSCMEFTARQAGSKEGKPNANTRHQHLLQNMCRRTSFQQTYVTRHDTQRLLTIPSTNCNYNSARTRWFITCRSSTWKLLLEALRYRMHKPAGFIPAGIVDMKNDTSVEQCTSKNKTNFMQVQTRSCTNVTQIHEDGDILSMLRFSLLVFLFTCWLFFCV